MKIGLDEYEMMRAWLARVIPLVFPAELLQDERHPIAVLDRMAIGSPSKARAGLAMTIGDILELTAGLPSHLEGKINDELTQARLPSLTVMKARFSKDVARVISRGSIRNDVEYYALRNAAEMERDDSASLWELISNYEQELSRKQS